MRRLVGSAGPHDVNQSGDVASHAVVLVHRVAEHAGLGGEFSADEPQAIVHTGRGVGA